MTAVTTAIEKIGLSSIARRLGYFPSAIQKWRDDGRLPKSELAGLTNYADVIAELSEGSVTAEELLSATRLSWMEDQEEKKRDRNPALLSLGARVVKRVKKSVRHKKVAGK
jgi:hypothetical protein